MKIEDTLNKLWDLLDKRSNKIKKYEKENSFKNFLDRIENAKSSINLFGLNFPNYMTNPDNKIFMALRKLEKSNQNVEVKIFIPNLKVKNTIEKLNIYHNEYNTLKRDWDKLQNFKSDFKTLNIKVIEYDTYIPFGFSLIDIETDNGFVHISKVIKNENIKDAEYFNIENDKRINALMHKIIKNMEK